jgi:predicted metal-dependent phosphotriesterase family hydrolase
MREAATLGAFLEFVSGSIAGAEGQAKLARFADAIRQVGPESCILSSDLGQEGNPLPADGFGEFILAMRDRGFTDQELDRMTRENPARLLGLP